VDDIICGVVGEPLKVLGLPPGARAEGWTALVVDNVAQLAANASFLVLLFAALCGMHAACFPVHSGAVSWPVALLFAGIAATVVAVAWRGARSRFNAAATSTADQRWQGIRGVMRRALGALLRAAQHMRSDPVRFGACFFLHLLGKLWMAVEMGIALHAIGIVNLTAPIALSAAGSVGALVGAPIPWQLGAIDAAYGATGSWVGIPLAAAAAVAVLRRARALPWLVLGVVAARRIMQQDPTFRANRSALALPRFESPRELHRPVGPAAAVRTA